MRHGQKTPLRIRLPEALKAKIQALAAENRRSMNAEIVARLEASLNPDATAAYDARLRNVEATAEAALELVDELKVEFAELKARLNQDQTTAMGSPSLELIRRGKRLIDK